MRRVVDLAGGSLAGSTCGAGGVDDAVALTFDDGPDPVGTPEVLGALARGGASATFFLLARRAARHGDLVRQIVAAGHEVALHGLDHTRPTSVAPEELEAQLRAGRAILEDLCSAPVTRFRPAFGAQSTRSFLAARRAGLDVVVWTAEGADWATADPAEVADRVFARVRPGGVVLLHERFEGPVEPGAQAEAGQVAAAVVGGLATRGWRGLSVAEMVAEGRRRRTVWFRP